METRIDTRFDCGLRIADCGMQAANLASLEFETRDVLAIAERCGLRIEFGRWAAVTAGEFERKAKTIRVNMNAVEELNLSVEKIIAHELGHYFFREYFTNKRDGAKNFDEEKFADDFAERLLKL